MLKQTQFLDGIIFEENPFENETPDEITVYDLQGNEVTRDEAE